MLLVRGVIKISTAIVLGGPINVRAFHYIPSLDVIFLWLSGQIPIYYNKVMFKNVNLLRVCDA